MNGVAVAVFDVAPGAVTLTVQATCMLLVAFVLAWLGRRGSPRTLHLLWTTTFVLVLALPLLGLIGPSWEVSLLPTAADAPRPALSPGSSATPLADMVPVPPPDATAMREALEPEELARLDAGFGGADGAPADAPMRHLVVRIAWIVWIVGCVLSLVPLAAATLRLRRLVGTARPVRGQEWAREAEELRFRLGLRSRIRLLSSAAVAMPMTAGLRRPVILLPESAATWSRERRAAVLAHELIHVRRRDALRQLVRRGVCAFYWFHPFVWAAERFADLASEKACDEGVLVLLGARPSEYARHLLFLAAGLSRKTRVPALAIAYPSRLERRIMSILAHRRPHPSLVRSALTLMIIGVAGVTVSAARPVPTQVCAVAGDCYAENTSVKCGDGYCCKVAASDSEICDCFEQVCVDRDLAYRIDGNDLVWSDVRAVSTDDSLLVVLTGSHPVAHLFDLADGSRRGSWGLSGQGPGEFQSASGVALVGRHVYALDGNQGRLSIFEFTGDLVRTLPLRDFGMPPNFPRWLHRAGGDTVLFGLSVPMGNERSIIALSFGASADEDPVGQETLIDYPRTTATRLRLTAPDAPSLNLAPPYWPDPQWAPVSGGVALWQGPDSDVRILGLDGEQRSVVTLALGDRFEVTAEDRELWFQNAIPQEIFGQRGVFDPLREVARRTVDFPRYHPPVFELLSGPDDLLWVRRTPDGRDQVWDVVDAQGQLASRVSLAPRQGLMAVIPDRLVLKVTDALGVESVEVYRCVSAGGLSRQ